MIVFRASFLCFMIWLLVVFLPSHVRGQITIGAKSGDSCCAPAVVEDCCAAKHSSSGSSSDKSSAGKPSDKDKANCAVCAWAAGLLSDIAVEFDHAFAEAAFAHARHYDAQVKCVALRLTHHGRDPPTMLA